VLYSLEELQPEARPSLLDLCFDSCRDDVTRDE